MSPLDAKIKPNMALNAYNVSLIVEAVAAPSSFDGLRMKSLV